MVLRGIPDAHASLLRDRENGRRNILRLLTFKPWRVPKACLTAVAKGDRRHRAEKVHVCVIARVARTHPSALSLLPL